MEKYLLTIEFRYSDSPDGESEKYMMKKVTLGVFDTRDEANTEGNKALEIFEKHFKLNPNYNSKERFSNRGGCFGTPKDLICNGAYVLTPFEFYAKITKLKYDDVEQTILSALEATKRYREYCLSNKD